MIIVDGTKSASSIATFENLEQALVSIMQDEKMENRVITDVLVNDEAFSEIYPHQAEDITCDAISCLELLQDLLDVTRDFMNMLGDLRGRYAEEDSFGFAEKTETLSALISEMSAVLENEDWILLADLLEYEFMPLCAQWRTVSEQMHQQIVRCVAQ